MTDYKYDVLNDMTDDELIEALTDRLADYRRNNVNGFNATHWQDVAAKYLAIINMVEQNLEAGIEPRHIIRHMKNMKKDVTEK